MAEGEDCKSSIIYQRWESSDESPSICRHVWIVCYERPSTPCRQHFRTPKAEQRSIAPAAMFPSGDSGAERLSCILDDCYPELATDFDEARHRRRAAKNMDRQECPR